MQEEPNITQGEGSLGADDGDLSPDHASLRNDNGGANQHSDNHRSTPKGTWEKLYQGFSVTGHSYQRELLEERSTEFPFRPMINPTSQRLAGQTGPYGYQTMSSHGIIPERVEELYRIGTARNLEEAARARVRPHEREEEALLECSFNPELNPVSRAIVEEQSLQQGQRHFFWRTLAWRQAVDDRVDAQRRAKEQLQLEECSFSPRLNPQRQLRHAPSSEPAHSPRARINSAHVAAGDPVCFPVPGVYLVHVKDHEVRRNRNHAVGCSSAMQAGSAPQPGAKGSHGNTVPVHVGGQERPEDEQSQYGLQGSMVQVPLHMVYGVHEQPAQSASLMKFYQRQEAARQRRLEERQALDLCQGQGWKAELTIPKGPSMLDRPKPAQLSKMMARRTP